jgi:hypothetical protein
LYFPFKTRSVFIYLIAFLFNYFKEGVSSTRQHTLTLELLASSNAP